MLTKEKEEVVKERDQAKQFSENLRKKYEIDTTGIDATGRKGRKKKKSNITSPVMLQ